MSSIGTSATTHEAAEPMAVTHVLPGGWRALSLVGIGFLLCLLSGALILPFLIPHPLAVVLGAIVAAALGPLLLLTLANPVAHSIVRDVDGMTVTTRRATYFLAWDQLVGVRDRGVLGLVELIAADGTIVRIAHKTDGLTDLLSAALERVAPKVPAEFRGSRVGPVFAVLALFAIPASIEWRGGVLTIAWIVAAAGAFALTTSLRSVRLTASGVELRRLLGRRVASLRAISDLRLVPPFRSGSILVEISTRENEHLLVDLGGGRALPLYGALDRELTRIHGAAWTRRYEIIEATHEVDVDAALKAYPEREGSADAAP